MKTLTVFTPAFNRGYCLDKCYKSLVSQTCKDFEWLIVDDGSTDQTRELAAEWIGEGLLDITYIWQENQGMHGAHNTAYANIRTELNVCIDSDDFMLPDAVEKIISFWKTYGHSGVSGMIALNATADMKVLGTEMPENLKSTTLFDLYYKHGAAGDKKLIYRSELTKLFPYPLFPNEKYVGLAYKYYMLDRDYPLLLLNEKVCVVEYLPDGSSLNMGQQYRKNPAGFSFYRKELMKLPYTGILFKFRQAIHYVSSNLMRANMKFIKESPCRLLTVLALPFGIILYVSLMLRVKVV